MSTAGKVLTVLSALMLLVWIVLISAVAQLNMDAGKRVGELKKQVVGLQAEATKAEHDALDVRDQVTVEQVGMERNLTLVRNRLTAAERQLTETRERLTRLGFQVEAYTKALASSKEDLAARNREKADLEKSKADLEALVGRLKGENAERLDQLTKLRSDFQRAREKNVAGLDALRKGQGIGRPSGRPVSFSR